MVAEQMQANSNCEDRQRQVGFARLECAAGLADRAGRTHRRLGWRIRRPGVRAVALTRGASL